MLLIQFIIAFILSTVIPGIILLSFINRHAKTKIVSISLIIGCGMLLFSWQAYMFGIFNMREASYVYVLLSFLYGCYLFIANLHKNSRFISQLSHKYINHFKPTIHHVIAVLLITLGVFVQVSGIWFNGTEVNGGIVFIGGDTSDNLFNASLTKEITERFPPQQPGMSGFPVINYHYWSSLTVAEYSRLFRLPLLTLQFQLLPIVLSLFLGIALYEFGYILKIRKRIVHFIVFFTYFGGDLLYTFVILFNKTVQSPFIMSSLEDGHKFFMNPPRAFAFSLSFAGFVALAYYTKNKRIQFILLASWIFGTMVGFKAHIGILLLSGLAAVCLYILLKNRSLKQTLFIGAAALITAVLIYLPVNKNSGGFVFVPFNITRNFIVQPPLNLIRLELARKIFYDDQKMIKALLFDLLFLALYVIGIFGTKVIGFIHTKRSLQSLNSPVATIVLAIGIIISSILGIFFIQQSGSGNSFNFIVSAFLYMSFLAGMTLGYFSYSRVPKLIKVSVIVLIIGLTISRVAYETTKSILTYKTWKPYIISSKELELYSYLNANAADNELIAVDPSSKLTAYSPYQRLFLSKPLYLTGNRILKSHQIDIEAREEAMDKIIRNGNELVVARTLLDENINYLVLYNDNELEATKSAAFLETLVQNESGTVYRVNRDNIIGSLSRLYCPKDNKD